ncbi:MAG TPA: HIT family protein [Candidatus Saccharimonadales bacterium]|nr:HIT family protein [Candidatus Saccharimonadales bacterium]
MTEPTLFDRIIAREIPAHIIWEDDQYCAFLTPFANTPGVTVVVPKKNPGEYAFDLSDEQLTGLMLATKKVARALGRALNARIGMVFEGEAVPHVHAKLYPMHNMQADRSTFPKATVFNPVYPGYITTQEGPKMADEQLTAISQTIKEAFDHED